MLYLLGTTVNAVAILFGSLIGIWIPKIPDRMKNTIMQGLALAVVLIGLDMALSDGKDIIVIIVSLVLGALLGEWINIEGGLERFGEFIERTLVRRGNQVDEEGPQRSIAEGFVVASLVYCIGSMAILGAIQSGLQGDHKTLLAKSMLDGISSIVFSSTLGIGVGLSALPVFVYEGLIATISHFAGVTLNSPEIIRCMTATGGLLIVGIGINILGIKKINVGNLLPAMFTAPVLEWVVLHTALSHVL